ncbi:hypothetical protein XENOCAPTIV_020732 [Xenoophorus captivus]|uniref:Uncharacterized protein n=1 Tax=Xenoophorus captivus TaxID=1517983 RepID=A0ABV0RIB7_9TELE
MTYCEGHHRQWWRRRQKIEQEEMRTAMFFFLQLQFHLLARRGSLPLLMVTEDFVVVGGPAALTGGAPLPVDRPFGRPTLPNVGSRGAPGVGLLGNGGIAPLPEVETQESHRDIRRMKENK